MHQQPLEPLAYTIKGALERVPFTGRTKLLEEIDAGRLKTKRLGRRVLILADDLKAWVESLPEAA